MSEDTLGSGLYLDRSLDLDVGEVGDLRATSGSDELQKDLAFQLLIILSEYKGEPLGPDTEAEIKSKTVDTIMSDTRVDSINRTSMIVTKPTPNNIKIQSSVQAGSDSQELVFTI